MSSSLIVPVAVASALASVALPGDDRFTRNVSLASSTLSAAVSTLAVVFVCPAAMVAVVAGTAV